MMAMDMHARAESAVSLVNGEHDGASALDREEWRAGMTVGGASAMVQT